MEYLLTWYDGEEVNYRFLQEEELKRVNFELDKPYTLTELTTGRVIPNVRSYLKYN